MFNKSMLALFTVCLMIGTLLAVNLHADFQDSQLNMGNPIVDEKTLESISNVTKVQKNHNQTNEEIDSQTEKKQDFYTLIVGIDFRQHELMLNTDSIMVAHIIPQHQQVKLVSIPRDTRVTNLQGQFAKVNSIFNAGYQFALEKSREDPSLLSGKRINMGAAKIPEEYISSGMVELRETVEQFLDVHIEHSVLVNFETVISLVDAVGGIEINVDRSMQYDAEFDNTHIHLEKGVQILDGQNALNFARFREDNRGLEYFSNDFERGVRQQQVISALADQLASWESITKVFNLLDIVTANIKTDMNLPTMQSIVRKYFGHINSDAIITIPFEGYWESPFVKINEDDLEQLKANLTLVEE